MYLLILNYTLKLGQDGKFNVVCILPQLKIIQTLVKKKKKKN